jgi:hypothetical protein
VATLSPPAASAPNVEREIGFDLVRRGVIVAPVVIVACGALRGWEGVISAGLAVAIVAVNFAIAALIMTRAARSGNPTSIAIGACVGYLVRLGVVLAALILLHHQGWIDLPMFGIVLVATHLGLLFWEMKYLSITLGAPALRPEPLSARGER